jgi:aldehyde dehydrogenase (NAD+)
MSDLIKELTAPNGLKYSQPIGLFINNEFVLPKEGGKFASVNPANEEDIVHVYAAGAEDVDIAVAAARKALKAPAWRQLGGTGRGKLLLKLADLIEENAHTLATIECWDNGKPYQHALAVDITSTANVIRYYGGWADKIQGEIIETVPSKLAYTIREPIGVCGQIIPWNFPLIMAGWKLGPALACGNTVVLKPAEQTPLSALFLAQLIKEAGFPPGVVNVLNGFGRVAGAAIAAHLDIDKVAFTGSTQTGKEIMKLASSNLKNISLETGGKSPIIIFDDADFNEAVRWAHQGIMFNSGQICTANSRIFVQEGIYTKFVAAFKEQIAKVSKIGDPFADDTFQGPQVTNAQFERVMSYIEAGKAEGATLTAGGVAHKDVNGKGFFIQPTVFTDVQDHHRIYREEVFGPFAIISSFKDEEEAIRRANDSTFGLGSSVFTENLKKAHRVARDIEAGMVWVNSSNDSDFRIPFGGVKQSGIGRELGEAGLAAYSQIKAVHINMA